MTDKEGVVKLVNLYRHHGWRVKKVIAAEADFEILSNLMRCLEPGISFREGKVSCIWFTRRSRPDCETWELRRLKEPPFALVKVLPYYLSADEKDNELLEVENRLLQAE
jgi:hypothetical protein